MTLKRLWYTFRLYTIRGNSKRIKYLRNKDIYGHIGDNCTITKRKIPLYPKLIRIGDNVHIASNVGFITHDITHSVLNNLERVKIKGRVKEHIGCIEIGDNVFVGAGSRILYDTRIGSNVIIGTGSIITKDIPDNCVVAGVPARKIGTFDEYVEKRLSAMDEYPSELEPQKQEVCDDLVEFMWEKFSKKHDMNSKDQGYKKITQY